MNPINSTTSSTHLSESEEIEQSQEQGNLNGHSMQDYTASIEEHPTGAKALAKKVSESLLGEKWTLGTGVGVGGGSLAATGTMLGLSFMATFPASLGIGIVALTVMSAVSIPLMYVVAVDYMLREGNDSTEKSPLPEVEPEKEIPKKKIDIKPENDELPEMDIAASSSTSDSDDEIEMEIGRTLEQKGEEAERLASKKKSNSGPSVHIVNGEVVIDNS